ncbi:Vegetative incompatibility protein HET-E-1-like protein 15, partial [Paraphaeosphaeria sporulosa]
WPDIEERLTRAGPRVRLSLELNTKSVSTAVSVFVKQKVLQLAQERKYDNKTRDLVEQHLLSNANGTFLWVALVCQDLRNIPRWKVLAKLGTFSPGLDSLYRQMLDQINISDDADLCIRILASVATVYRPVTLRELASLVEMLDEVGDLESLQEIISLCGSFLTVRSGVVYFVHQSAKDFLIEKVPRGIFPSGREEIHHVLFSRSLQIMSMTLRRDMYGLGALGYPTEQIEPPVPDPLEASRYSCMYWIDHLYDWTATSSAEDEVDLQDGGAVDSFLRQHYLYWLEALSLCKNMSKGVVAMTQLKVSIHERGDALELNKLVEDARRFIMSHKMAIERSPLQAYASALLFSPTQSLIRGLFKKEEPDWITIKPAIAKTWSPCLLTLEGHSDRVYSVAFSHDSARIASTSGDHTVKIWDVRSGECLSTLEGHSDRVYSVAFSHDSARIASTSGDHTVKIWDVRSGECLSTLEGHSDWISSVTFSHDSAWVASALDDHTVKIWDACSGECLSTLEGHIGWVLMVAFSHDLERIASASWDGTVKIWDAHTGKCLSTLEGHSNEVNSVTFSHDSAWVASASDDHTVKIWDANGGMYLSMLEGHSGYVHSVPFSHDSMRVASASNDRTVKIWDARSGECLSTLEGHSDRVGSVTFSHDSARIASTSDDETVKIWDARSGKCLSTLEGHGSWVHSVAFSHDSTQVASASNDHTVKLWDVRSGECLSTLEGHSLGVTSVAFGHDAAQLVSGAADRTVKLWDACSGECLLTVKGHSDIVASVVFSPDSAQIASASDDHTVKIWETSSGKCLSTLQVGQALHLVAFDVSGSYLHTNIGTIDVSALSDPASLTIVSEPYSPQYHGLALSADGLWITYGAEHLVWLPSEYRPSCSAVSRDRISIGVGTGRVWICKIERNRSQTQGVRPCR